MEHDTFLPATAKKVSLLRLVRLIRVTLGQLKTVSIALMDAIKSEENDLPLEKYVGRDGLVLCEIWLCLKMEDVGMIIVFCDKG
jgi:hypothetical protein